MSIQLLPLKKISTYLNSGISRPFFSEGKGIPVLRSNNVRNGSVNVDDLKFWHKVDPRGANLENVKPADGDLLVNFVNGSSKELGKAGVYRGIPENCIVSTNFFILRLNKQKAFVEYVVYFFQSYLYKKWLYTVAGFSGQGSFNKTEFEKLRIPTPPLPEQKAIADLLTTWDEAIEKTERLIQAKETRYKRLLNDLIHQGRSNHTWQGYNLSDLCSPVSRKNGENNTNVLTSSAQNGLVSQLEYYNKSVSAENVTGYYLLKRGEFAYNRSSAKGYPYGATKRLNRYEKGVLSTLYLCFALKPDAPCESDFLLHLFESGAANRELRAVCQEGARSHGLMNITKSDFFGIKLFLPTHEQQKKIQSALNTAQEEIDLLKQLAEKSKIQKRGLMQKMLTGEWRVKPEIVNQYMEA